MAIVSVTPRQWRDLAEIVEHPELATDLRFNNLIAQVNNHAEAVALIEEWTSQHTSAEIVRILEDRKIPCGVAYSVNQVNEDANLRARGMFQTVEHAQYGTIDIPGIPYHFSRTPGKITMPAPGLGEHNQLLLEQWLGQHQEGYRPAQGGGHYHVNVTPGPAGSGNSDNEEGARKDAH